MVLRAVMSMPLIGLCCSFVPYATSAQPVMRWSLTEELRIGSMNDERTAFARVGAVRVSSAGYIYVAEPVDGQLRVFDANGKPITVIGRKGRGPGEMQAISELGFLGDTVYVLDASLRRISYFRSSGAFIRSQQVNASARVSEPRFPTVLFPDGTAIAFLRLTMLPATVWLVVDRSGAVLDTLRRYDQLLPSPTSAQGVISASPQQPSAPLHGLSHDGRYIYLVDRPIPTNSRETSFSVTRISSKGDSVWRREYRYVPISVTRSEYDRLIAQGARRGYSASQLRQLRPYVPFRSPVAAIIVSHDGTLWITPEMPPNDALVPWYVYDVAGERIATVEIPKNVRLMTVKRDAVYAVMTDDLGVEYIVRYRVIR